MSLFADESLFYVTDGDLKKFDFEFTFESFEEVDF
jgi:hypothetical protein